MNFASDLQVFWIHIVCRRHNVLLTQMEFHLSSVHIFRFSRKHLSMFHFNLNTGSLSSTKFIRRTFEPFHLSVNVVSAHVQLTKDRVFILQVNFIDFSVKINGPQVVDVLWWSHEWNINVRDATLRTDVKMETKQFSLVCPRSVWCQPRRRGKLRIPPWHLPFSSKKTRDNETSVGLEPQASGGWNFIFEKWPKIQNYKVKVIFVVKFPMCFETSIGTE